MILLDLRMQDLHGLEATRRLKSDAQTAVIPVLAVTASAFGDVRQAATEAGCVDFVPKPVRADRLFAKLHQHLGVRFVSAPDEQADCEADGDPASLPPHLIRRLREAAAIGNVAAIQALVRELEAAGPAASALARRIARLAAAFDYQGLLALTQASGAEGVSVEGR